MKRKLERACCVFLILASAFVWAEDSTESKSNEIVFDEPKLETRAQRPYPGGADEEDLMVQKDLFEPVTRVDKTRITSQFKEVFKTTRKPQATERSDAKPDTEEEFSSDDGDTPSSQEND